MPLGLQISYEEMRAMVVDYLTQKSEGQMNDLRAGLGPLAAKRFGITPDENGHFGLIKEHFGHGILLHQTDCGKAEAIMWDRGMGVS